MKKRTKLPKRAVNYSASKEVLDAITAGKPKDGVHVGMASVVGFRSEPGWWVSTGIEALDHYALSRGGLPGGRISEIYGPPGCGKSSLVYRMLGLVQARGGVAVLIHSEAAGQLARLPTFGVDTENLILVEGGTQGVSTVAALEKIRAVSESVAKMDPKPPLAIVWDSLAVSGNIDEKIGEIDFDRRPAALSKGWRIVAPIVAEAQGHVAVVNQIRDKIGARFGPKVTTPGGHSTKHMATTRLDMAYIGKVKSGDTVVGIKVKIHVQKHKVGVPFRSIETRLLFKSGWDNDWTNLELAKDWGLIPKKSTDVDTAVNMLEDCGWDPDVAKRSIKGRVVELDIA